jgi:CTD small phosphatase-like protein 2
MVESMDLSKTILVDNSASSFGVQPHNGIPIVPYFFKQDDIELIKLRNFLFALEKLIKQGFDARIILKKYFKLDEYSKAKDFDDLHSLLFEE